MKKLFLAIFVIAIFAVSCTADVKRTYKMETTKKVETVVPINYGNGVYYFRCTNNTFAKSLSLFLSDSTKKVKAVAGDGTGVNGYNEGFFVIVEK
jgi:hypothetical protein